MRRKSLAVSLNLLISRATNCIHLPSWKNLISPLGEAKNRIDEASNSEAEEALYPSLAGVLTLSIESKRAASAGLECNAVHAGLRETEDVHPRNVLGETIPLAVAADISSNNETY